MNRLKQLNNVLFFLVILFLPTQLGLHFWPAFSSIFSLPVDYLSPTVYFWDILIGLLCVLWLNQRPRAFLYHPYLGLLLFFWLAQALSLLAAENIGAGLVRLEQIVIMGIFGLYISSLKKQELFDSLRLPLLLGIVFESLLAGLEVLNEGSLNVWILGERTFTISTPAIAKFNFFGAEFLRPYGTFPHPNVLSAYLLIGSVLLFGLCRYQKPWWLFISGAAILLSFSRVAWIVSFSWTAQWLWLIDFKKHRRTALILALTVGPFIVVRLMSAFNFDALSYYRREDLNRVAVQLFESSPIFGVGLNNFIPHLSVLPSVSGTTRFLQPVHNIFLLILSETGLVGLLGYALLFGTAIKRLWLVRAEGHNRILLGLWLTVFVLGMFDHYFLTLPQGQRILFLLWSLSMLQ